jgi:hypothetical protein
MVKLQLEFAAGEASKLETHHEQALFLWIDNNCLYHAWSTKEPAGVNKIWPESSMDIFRHLEGTIFQITKDVRFQCSYQYDTGMKV